MSILAGCIVGFLVWFFVRYGVFGFFTVDQNERAVKTVFGRAQRLASGTDAVAPGGGAPTGSPEMDLDEDERERYNFPQLRVYEPGGPYFKLPWEKVYKVSIATETISMAYDPEVPTANSGGKILEAVTKDQLNTGLTGQIRYRVSERNLYAYLFGVKNPLAHVMGYFISVLRERIATFEAPNPVPLIPEGEDGVPEAVEESVVEGISINDLRKNLRDINEHMQHECRTSAARYGIVLDASLITGIDPPEDVDSALAAINTAHNHVSSEVSLARAKADQRLVQSKRAVEIETHKAFAEVEPLDALAEQLTELKNSGSGVLAAYLRNVRLGLYERAQKIFLEARP